MMLLTRVKAEGGGRGVEAGPAFAMTTHDAQTVMLSESYWEAFCLCEHTLMVVL